MALTEEQKRAIKKQYKQIDEESEAIQLFHFLALEVARRRERRNQLIKGFFIGAFTLVVIIGILGGW